MTITESIKILIRKMLAFRYMHSGDYVCWEEAQKKCIGYDADNILKKVEQAVLKVKRGEAAFERDSVLFDTIEYSWPLVSGLMWVAAQNSGQLKVLDFGGSLGSSYFQNRKFLDTLNKVEWQVVEQKNFVLSGQKNIQDKQIQFYHSVEEAIRECGKPDVLLMACVLPYLEKPYQTLNDLMQYNIPYLIIDNTYFNYENRDRICIQKVPSTIYEASYPCWLLDYERVKSTISSHYTIISEHTNDLALFLNGRKIPYRGMLLRNKTIDTSIAKQI